MLLMQDALCVCQINGIIGASQPKISKNLSKLRDLNYVIDTRKEKFVYYTLNKEHPLLLKTLESIFSDLEDYPILIQDRSKSLHKEQFITVSQIEHMY